MLGETRVMMELPGASRGYLRRARRKRKYISPPNALTSPLTFREG